MDTRLRESGSVPFQTARANVPYTRGVFMRVKNPIYVLCLVLAVVLVLSVTGCGEEGADPTSSSESVSDPVAGAEDAADTGPTNEDSPEFDDIPEIVGYEVTKQEQRSNELYVNLLGETTEEEALQVFANWAEGEGWTALDMDWPNIDLAFEKPDRVYPLRISVFPHPASGEVEVLVIMPAVGDKLGDW